MNTPSVRNMPCQVGDKNYNAKQVRNVKTGEIYTTVKQAADACNLTPSYLVQMLKGYRDNTSGMTYYNKPINKPAFQRAKW